jgi:hypothetical protein
MLSINVYDVLRAGMATPCPYMKTGKLRGTYIDLMPPRATSEYGVAPQRPNASLCTGMALPCPTAPRLGRAGARCVARPGADT